MIKLKIVTLTSLLLGLLITVSPVFAHTVVKPAQAGIASLTDFSLGVPSEKDVATVGVKLMIPEGINSVSPIVKPGWKVEVINSTKPGQPDDDGNTNPIPEAIVWTGGSVPAHQKDFFMFSTQVPAKETELDWKVEQTYADGTTVSWTKSAAEQPKDEKGNPDYSKFGPFAKTMVVNDLKNSDMGSTTFTKPAANSTVDYSSSKSDKLSFTLSGLAIILAASALVMQLKRK